MKIGISVTPLYTIEGHPKKIDGIGTYTSELYQALIRQNIPLIPIYFRRIQETFLTAPAAEKKFLIAQNPVYSLIPGNFYSAFNNKIDLLHITNYLVPRVKNIPTIATLHDAIMLKHAAWLGGCAWLRAAKQQVFTSLAKNINGAIAISRAVVPDLVEFWKIPEQNISVVYYGISSAWHQRADAQLREAILKKYRLTKPFFLTVGTIQPRKNIDRMIDAYLNLPKTIRDSFDFVIVGQNYPRLTPINLADKIHRLAALKQLHWLKYVPFSDLCCLYQSATALLYPSLAEGFGFPILEGFASATPVITSQEGATAEIAGNAAYLVDPYSQAAIQAAIIELVEKPDIGKRLVEKGLARVQLFSWEKCAEETQKVYRKFA